MGGTIASGTYYLTEVLNYGGTASNDPICTTARYHGILQFTATSATEGTLSGTYVTSVDQSTTPGDGWTYQLNSDATLTATRSCGSTGAFTRGYSATPTQYTYFSGADSLCYKGSMVVQTYVKQ
jgi:hypothetical protein